MSLQQGMCLAAIVGMNSQEQIPQDVPTPEAPLGDRGHGDKTWTPPEGEQGISNRVEDEDPDADTDPSKD